MGKSRRLRLADVRAAMRLVGECRDLGYDPALWLRRAFEGLCGIIGARVVLGGEARWNRPAGPIVPRLGIQAGLTPEDERKYLGYFHGGGLNADVFLDRLRTVPARRYA